MAIDRSDLITRRGFLELTSAGLVSTGLLKDANAAEHALGTENTASLDAAPSVSKIALEEHFAIPETFASSYAVKDLPSPEAKDKLLDIGAARVAEMDRGGVGIAILSLVAPGIQAIPNVPQAIDTARRANDYLAEHIAKHPKRLKGFAALPLQNARPVLGRLPARRHD